MFASFRDVIACWPSPNAMASDMGVPSSTIRKWRSRDSVPAKFWSRIVKSEFGKACTLEDLALLAERGDDQ